MEQGLVNERGERADGDEGRGAGVEDVVAQGAERPGEVGFGEIGRGELVVEALAGDEGPQVVDVALAFDVSAPTDEAVENGDGERREQDGVNRIQVRGGAEADDEAKPASEDDGPPPMADQPAPGESLAGEDFVSDDGLPHAEGGEADEKFNEQVKEGQSGGMKSQK